MHVSRSILLAAAVSVLALSTAARAEDAGWYVNGASGVNLENRSKVEMNGNTTRLSLDPGAIVNGAVGYDFGAVRAEGELGWRYNSVGKVDGAAAGGTSEAWSAMANGYYDIHTGTAITPYLGLGLGLAYVEAERVHVGNSHNFSASGVVPAFQGIVGARYDIDRNWALNADYRYFSTADVIVHDSRDDKVHVPYHSNSFLMGVTYRFGGAEPTPVVAVAPPAPVPAPEPTPAPAPIHQVVAAHNFLVFFDFDKSALSPAANAIVDNAAEQAKSHGVAQISVTGHTDQAGGDKYNMALSLKRAEAVKTELVRKGIPADTIVVVGKGKSEPLVPTNDGVREPQNRRVEIILP